MHEVRYEVQAAGKRADAGSLRACRELIRSRVPRRARVHVIAKGDPVWLDLYGRPTATFPQDEDGRYPASRSPRASARSPTSRLSVTGAPISRSQRMPPGGASDTRSSPPTSPPATR